jgi:nucleoside-diphosphate-sugar epimerase
LPKRDTRWPRCCASAWRRKWRVGTQAPVSSGLRISNIFEPPDYAAIPAFWDDPALRRWNLWSWVDARDVAQACRLALEADIQGAEHFTIAAADTLMRESSAALMAKAFPGVSVQPGIGEFDTLLSIDKAKRMLGYQPKPHLARPILT